jgi:hypothetical protein
MIIIIFKIGEQKEGKFLIIDNLEDREDSLGDSEDSLEGLIKIQEDPIEICLDYLGDNQYFICCREKGKLIDCNQKQSFSSGESIEIALNPQKFDIPETFYVCFASDLLDYATKQPKEEQCFIGNKYTATWWVMGTVPEGKEEFSLVTITEYPNENFDKSQKQSLINLTGKLNNLNDVKN